MRRRNQNEFIPAIVVGMFFIVPLFISFKTGWNFGVVFFLFFVTISFICILIYKKIKNPNLKKETIYDKEYYKKSMIGIWFKPKEYFFTRSEKTFFDILNKENNGKYTILSKVRMEDIVEAIKEAPFGKRNHIKSRHLDFVLLKNNEIISAIEVDGKSHYSEKQKESDKIKNEILEACKIKLYRIKVGSNFYEETKKIIIN